MNVSQLNRILQQMLLLPLLALLVVSGILVWQIRGAVGTVDRIQLADQNITTAIAISGLVVDEETGVRGYQVTRDKTFLQPYYAAAIPLADRFHHLRDGILKQHGNPAQVDALVLAHEKWQTLIAQPLLTAARHGVPTGDSAMNLRGKARMDSLRNHIANVLVQQREMRTAAVERFHREVRHTVEAALGLALIIGLMVGTHSRNQLRTLSAVFQRTLETLRRNAQEIQASEQRLRTILTSIGDAVVVCDLEGRVELLNTVAQQLTGYSQEEAEHKPVDEVFRIVDDVTREPLETPVAIVAREKRIVSLPNHTLMVQRNGTLIHIDDSGAPIVDRSGSMTGVVMVFRDVTGHRRTQAALLASEKLAVAGRLAATIAHEIHNPLDAVINLLYLLRQGATPEETQQFLEMASSELDRVAQISRAMLGMYRESRTPMALDLSDLLRSLLLLLEQHFAHAQVTVTTDLEAGTLVTGYPAELRQVFTNLLTNALDASERGGMLHVSARNTVSPEAPGVRVVVADTGVGIPEEARHHLFEPFFTTKGEQGTGLGLWVSQGIVQKHGGTIELETRTDDKHGTEITVFLPRGEAMLPADMLAHAKA